MNSPPDRPPVLAFNLLHEPWIPVRPLGGGPVREVGLRELLTRAREFGRIDDASPLISVALLRLSLALLHRALRGPSSAVVAAGWFRDGFPSDLLEAYLTEWADSFDLFHLEKPFWQVHDLNPDLDGGKYRSHWTRLGSEVGSANTSALFNLALRPGGEQRSSLTPAEAARRLVEGQTFLLGGLIKRLTTAAKAAPVATFALITPQGENLHETLCLNLTPYPDYASDQAVWERAPLTVAAVREYYELELADVPRGRADRYTWPSRSVLLVPELDLGGAVRVSTIGFAAGIPLDGPGEGAAAGLDPMVTIRAPADPKKPERFPLKLRREQLLWRDLSALLPDPHRTPVALGASGMEQFRSAGGGQTPGVLMHARRVLEALGRHGELSVTVSGQLSDQGKAFAYRQERYTFPGAYVQDAEAFAVQVEQALKGASGVAEGLRQATARLAAEVISRGGERDPHKDDVAALARTLPGIATYWAGLDAPFRVFLAGLAAPEQAHVDWITATERQARRAWALNLQGAGQGGEVVGFAYRPRRTDGRYQPSPQALLDRALRALRRTSPILSSATVPLEEATP